MYIEVYSFTCVDVGKHHGVIYYNRIWLFWKNVSGLHLVLYSPQEQISSEYNYGMVQSQLLLY